MSVCLCVAPGTDRHHYNTPTANECAVILPTGVQNAEPQDIILWRWGGPLQWISGCHPAYAPLQYPLLFPYGENGWHPALENGASDGDERKITQMQFAAYQLHNRPNEFSCLLHGRHLFTHWMVDSYASIDQSWLLWLQLNQGKLRASLYSGLQDDADMSEGNFSLADLGQRTVLPSSYIGCPCHMQQQFQDSMGITCFFQKVDLFITVTTNPNWPEIFNELRPGETGYDHPDLVAWVFHEKK